jgi:hypothetical protein
MHKRHAGAFVALSAALLGACTLDTAPETPATRAPLEADAELGAPNVLAEAEAPNLTAPAPQPSAAVVQPSPGARVGPAAEPPAIAAAQVPEQNEESPAAAAPAEKQEQNGCQPGIYTGVITGTVNLAALVAVSTLAGTINLELVEDDQHDDVLVV